MFARCGWRGDAMRGEASTRTGEHGFTLIELLVSLALLGMAAALLLQGLATAGILAQREQKRAVGLEEVIAAQRVLRSAIERLRPLVRVQASLPIIEMRGTAGVLTYIGPPFDRASPDALQRFRLARTADGDLVLYNVSIRKAAIDATGRDVVGWTPNILLHGVREFSIDYLGPPRPGLPRGWQNQWWDRSTSPELIRIRVAFDDHDRRYWPDLLIRPRATRYGVCKPDPFTGKCEDEQ